MAKNLALIGFVYRLLPLFLKQQQPAQLGLSEKDRALLNLKSKEGAVILILGKRESGKTVLAYRLAEFLERPTYVVSPNQHPLPWMTEIKLEGIEEVPPKSTLIFDDLPVYMSSRDYSEALVRNVEKIIPVARHKGIIIIFVSQTSGYADRWVMDADAVFIKSPSLLYAELERGAVKKLMDRAAPYFAGQTPIWLQKHCYMVTDSWEGIIEIKKPD